MFILRANQKFHSWIILALTILVQVNCRFFIYIIIILNRAISNLDTIIILVWNSHYNKRNTFDLVFLTNWARIWCIIWLICTIIKVCNIITFQNFSEKWIHVIFIVKIFIKVWLLLIGVILITILVLNSAYKL
jgi:hypothetical protein